ncbi:ABC-type transport system involved in resistance to organic solvents, periplasmic component OS=Singulisphaera acidiphila (strain ATCC BAA-1392 / DSM 18658 / VKM B-2454 / MOB10) GN=Sinac_1321 PE=4 SV=1: MCE: OmpA [Gemmata massiliana]|uniref:OmpA-like domain-containing protein n=1 Tax=Gemmata massiliana TaxID=1210884 RepID=A0A6P2DJ67_9BACT|nr:MlaD family protein [Gemmata massiliana]VTS03186.1 ABC-type transport system involved in resistance to organic solvents, periplasmic component OS=Singulisphaera acidiphila (strain ATCC BAA-1392 / DSM 18658 / VKM B-2454 / MOB10) GN=Sinac_1321 PE=4 SV=1: MCE: OmpA [Gemmata massiliana]
MSQSLSRWQAVTLGLVVVVALVLGGYGIARIADKQGLWADTVEVTAGFPEAHDVTPGTPVRIRGVDAGQVIAVEYPDHDGPGAQVTVRMRLQAKFATRLYSDASAQIHGTGMLGSKVISIQPGDPNKGAIADGRLRGVKPFAFEEAVAEVRDLAKEAKGTATEVKSLASEARETVATAKDFIKDIEGSNGTFAKLVRDDDLYEDARGTLGDLRKLVGRTDKAVGTMESEVGNLRGFVADGRDTLKSVKQGSDALSRLPIVRNYVEDSVALLVRPTMSRTQMVYQSKDIFEPGTATLTGEGRRHLDGAANALKSNKAAGSEIVVVGFHNPKDQATQPAVAQELTKKQAEVVAEYLKAAGAHKLGTFSRRKIIPLGMGMNLAPTDPDPNAPSNVQILVFTPR